VLNKREKRKEKKKIEVGSKSFGKLEKILE
jgi:hypothetical protein